MITKKYVEEYINRLKNNIIRAKNNQNFEDCLQLTSVCANLLYQTNIYYRDDDLENIIRFLSNKLCLLNKNQYSKSDVCIFWDGFGLNDRGLAQIYLKSLCKIKKVIYITYKDRKNQISDLKKIIENTNNECLYVDRNNLSLCKQINQLNSFLQKYNPSTLFFYSLPDDVVGTTIMYAYEGLLKRIQINLTDHAFWLGAGCIDICIEFRNYGASISEHYRNIDVKNIRFIPFYPIIHYEREFQGFPFVLKDGQQVVFSGGSLYKTFGENDRYYKLVERLLNNYSNVIFWYAGSGDDSKIKQIIQKFPGRAYFTGERSDLFQILKQCTFYLSTYPICGGLMYQYAAKAGRVPVTLKYDECTEDFLLNQKKLKVEFSDENELFKEIDKLLCDPSYLKLREIELMSSLTTISDFEKNVEDLFSIEPQRYYECPVIDTKSFRKRYLDVLTKESIERITVRKNSLNVGLKYYPLRTIKVIIKIFSEKCLKKFLSANKICNQ